MKRFLFITFPENLCTQNSQQPVCIVCNVHLHFALELSFGGVVCSGYNFQDAPDGQIYRAIFIENMKWRFRPECRKITYKGLANNVLGAGCVGSISKNSNLK